MENNTIAHKKNSFLRTTEMEQLYTHMVIYQRIRFLKQVIFRLLILILQLENDTAACIKHEECVHRFSRRWAERFTIARISVIVKFLVIPH